MIEISVLVAVIGVAVSVGTFFIGRTTAAKNSGQQTGQVLTELGYIKKGIDGLEKKMERMEQQYNNLDVRVSKLEEIVRIYHAEG
jgi:peptidoglycan hydrolase CwlO-like protein